MPKVLIRYPDGRCLEEQLSQRPLSIGRSEVCDIVLPSDEISREHAEIWVDERGMVLVADKHSKNGTRVDGSEAFRSGVRAATRTIRIGEYELLVAGGSADAEDVRFQHDAPEQVSQTAYFPSTRPVPLDLNQRRLELLMSLTERIGSAFERRQLLEQALESCCEALGFERGMVALKTARGEPEQPITKNVARDETGAYTISRTLINKALVDGQCAVVNDLAVDLAGNITESLVRFPIRSALCVPIVHRSDILGVIYGDRVTQGAKYNEQDVMFLATIARQVGVGIANLRMLQDHLRAQRVFFELEQARLIQRRLFPESALAQGRAVLAGHNEPCDAVGGDYFDYFELDDGRIGLIIADVSGHGISSALVMSNLKGAVRATLTGEAALVDVARRLNRAVYLSTREHAYVTGIIGRLDTKTGALELVNAGHYGPLLVYPDGIRTVPDGLAYALGMFDDAEFTVQQVEPGNGLRAALFFTDGLIEATNSDGAMLDLEPVKLHLGELSEHTPDALLKSTLNLVRRHTGQRKNEDDLTLMALQYL